MCTEMGHESHPAVSRSEKKKLKEKVKTCSFHLKSSNGHQKGKKFHILNAWRFFWSMMRVILPQAFKRTGRRESKGYGYVQIRLFLSFSFRIEFFNLPLIQSRSSIVSQLSTSEKITFHLFVIVRREREKIHFM